MNIKFVSGLICNRVQIGKWDTMIGGNGAVLGIARHIDMNAIILAFNTSPDTATGYLFSEDIIKL